MNLDIKHEALVQRNLPMLNSIKMQCKGIDLSNTLIICIQHLYSTTYSLFEALFESGLEPENLFVLGKCYSTDPRVFYQLKERGAVVSDLSLHFDSYRPYDEDFDSAVDELLARVQIDKDLSQFDQVILLDDGGHLLEKAIQIFGHDKNIVGIEQTSSGYHRIAKLSLPFPIINLARAWLKLDYESPIIIQLVCRKLIEKVDLLEANVNNILIIGYGILGKCIHQHLKDQYHIDFYDPNLLDERGVQNLLSSLNRYDLIIGCTGTTSMPKENYKYCKKPVVFASVSSSDREFDAVHLRRQHSQVDQCHIDMKVGPITLLNSGFPVNFDHDHDLIDTDDFQLTRALLFASIYQASTDEFRGNGFIELRSDLQQKILTEIQK
jgi:S-adenosylhomocysteine hydrolase